MTTLRERSAQIAETEAEEIARQALEPTIASLLEMTASAHQAAQQTEANTRQVQEIYRRANELARTHGVRHYLLATLTAIIVSSLLWLTVWLALPSWKRSALTDAWNSSSPTARDSSTPTSSTARPSSGSTAPNGN